ncbi:hypothetical protein [Desertibaculum subflavum]|uniref:hypothetical protein n=1 Tax=Desertibaculum subflavum TaxID=2268458 RepID=UPI0013C497E4
MPIRRRFFATGLILLAAALTSLTTGVNFYRHLADNSAVPSDPIGTPLFLSVIHAFDALDDMHFRLSWATIGRAAPWASAPPSQPRPFPHPIDIYPYYHSQTWIGLRPDPSEALEGYGLQQLGVMLTNVEAGPDSRATCRLFSTSTPSRCGGSMSALST